MINKYEVIGREKIVYKSVVLANSSDEAEKKLRDYLMDVNLRDTYEKFVSGIEFEVNPITEEE